MAHCGKGIPQSANSVNMSTIPVTGTIALWYMSCSCCGIQASWEHEGSVKFVLMLFLAHGPLAQAGVWVTEADAHCISSVNAVRPCVVVANVWKYVHSPVPSDIMHHTGEFGMG
jgi:hypothetical protein